MPLKKITFFGASLMAEKYGQYALQAKLSKKFVILRKMKLCILFLLFEGGEKAYFHDKIIVFDLHVNFTFLDLILRLNNKIL